MRDRADLGLPTGEPSGLAGDAQRATAPGQTRSIGPIAVEGPEPLESEGSIRPYNGPELHELEPYLNEALAEWAETAFTTAPLSCTHDQVDNSSCAWYHGAWPALRALDVVSSPAWHHEFYSSNLYRKMRVPATRRILISGTADFSILAFVLAAVKGLDPQPEIHIIDLCPTPLEACLWYSLRTGGKIAVLQRSVLDLPEVLMEGPGKGSNEFFDLIVTDALLTRFEFGDAKDIVTNWFRLLRPGGSVITTVRLHPRDVSDGSASDFTAKVAGLVQLRREPSKITNHDLVAAADVYARRITSHNLGDVGDVSSLFIKVGFVLEHEDVAPVKGELTRTQYLRLVARKSLTAKVARSSSLI